MSRGHIRRQSEDSWELKFDLGRDPLTGKRITKYATFRGTRKKAEEELTRRLSQRDQGTFVEPTRQSLGQYLQHWLGADVERRLAARTAARHRGIVEKNIIPRLGTLPIRSLTAAHIEALEADLQREGWVKAQTKRSGEDNDAPPPKRGLRPGRSCMFTGRSLRH